MSLLGGVADRPACSTLDLHRSKNPCVLCSAAAYCCGAVGPRPIAALLGRFLPRLGPLVHSSGPFFFGRVYLCSSFRGARSANFDVQLHIRESISPLVHVARWIPGSRRVARPGMTR